jgi:hypothetical protein
MDYVDFEKMEKMFELEKEALNVGVPIENLKFFFEMTEEEQQNCLNYLKCTIH